MVVNSVVTPTTSTYPNATGGRGVVTPSRYTPPLMSTRGRGRSRTPTPIIPETNETETEFELLQSRFSRVDILGDEIENVNTRVDTLGTQMNALNSKMNRILELIVVGQNTSGINGSDGNIPRK